jgi:hypothetical protein
MVSAPENRVELVCWQVGERVPGPAEGWARCTVYVEAVTQLAALLPPAAATGLPANARWRVEAELVGPAMVRLTADPAHLEVLPD